MTEFTVVVQFFLDGAWTNVTRINDTCYVMDSVTITRGRAKQGQRMAPMQISFRMRDDLCWIDGENPASPYFRKILQGTPVRVAVDGDIRGTGEIATLEQVPGPTPQINFVDVTASGVLRRLDVAQRPLSSAAYDAFSAPENDAARIFYAPLEEESGAQFLTTFGGRGSIVYDTPVTLGGDTDSASSARLLRFGQNGKLEAEIPPYSSLEHKITGLWRLPANGVGNGNVLYRFHCTGGNIDRIHLRFNTPWSMSLDALRGFTVVATAVVVDWTGYIDQQQEFWMTCEFTQNGANIDCTVGIIREDGVFGVPTGSLNACTLGRIWHLTVGANDINGASFGQLAIGNDTGAFANYVTFVSNDAAGVNGYRSEFADTRMLRLCNANGVSFSVRQATLGDAAEMGPQRPAKLGDLIYECIDADDGILAEQKLFFALEYVTRFALYNQPPQARLRWPHLSAPFRPVTNDVDLYNDFQVTRPGGTSGRYAIPNGDYQHRTTEDPPDGVGPRPAQKTLNVWPDKETTSHAAWRAHIFSWQEKRFDKLTLDLASPAFTAFDRSRIRSLDPGHLLVIDTTGAPPYVPYTELRLLVQGYAETFSKVSHSITINTTPADIYEVGQVDADGSVLAAPITSSTTSIKIAPPTKGPEWTEDLGDRPYNIQVAGQPMRLTSISTDVPAFIAAGAVATANNAAVTPALPAGITPDVGQLLLVWATIRNSGAGVPDDEPGWDTLVSFGNCKLYGRYYQTGDVAPTITFTGGVANADTIARMFAFSGLSMQFASGTKGTPAAHTQLNGSVQDVSYPAMTITRDDAVAMIFLWKQDDFTTLSTPAGFTAAAADSSIAGDDAGIGMRYDLTAVAGAAGTITVTGGAAAISRAVVLALRPLQTATVVRGIASTATAAAAGSEIHGWRMGVNGL